MKLTVSVTNVTMAGLPIQHAVVFEVPDDATDEQIREAARRAMNAHTVAEKAHQEWVREQLTPEQLAEVQEFERLQAERQVQPRPVVGDRPRRLQ